MNAAELLATVQHDSARIDALVASVTELASFLGLQVEENADAINADRALRADLAAAIGRLDELERRIGNVAWRGELELVARKLEELERRGDNHLRYLDSLQETHDRLAERAAALENAAHSRSAR